MEMVFKKIIVKAVVDATINDIDGRTFTFVGFEDELDKITINDMWKNSVRFCGFTKDDVKDDNDIKDMENLWTEMINSNKKR